MAASTLEIHGGTFGLLFCVFIVVVVLATYNDMQNLRTCSYRVNYTISYICDCISNKIVY